jgi:hypothetical protein
MLLLVGRCVLFSVAMLCCNVATVGWAQVYGGARRQPEVPRENMEASGTVKGIQRGVIHLVTDAGDQWLVQVQAARPQDISFTGTAESDFIKPGMWVRFQTKLSRRGDAAEPVDSLEIFTPREGYEPGLYADLPTGGSNAAELFSDAPKPETKPKKSKAKTKPDEDTVYTVAGQVGKVSRLGELTISAGGTSVKAKLADEAKVRLDMGDLTFLQAGDKIEIRGWHPAGQKGQAVATQVTASAANPLADPSKKKKAAAAEEKPGEEKPSEDKPGEGKPADGKQADAETKKPPAKTDTEPE